ncbi:hypothetical protein DYB36_008947 [Aphanomyces astaci]|uniref:Myb/SANT-like domain-containing protein n=1 Tax=Aphanomyces astaci TaxID=112090 RepID=A0A396ZX28_APHAT|nr:hypothetical protein DYB36_008947 [Aphanomyces astaci]
MAKLKTPSKKELIEENRVLLAEMQAATFMIPLVGQPETPSEPRATQILSKHTDQMIVAFLEVRFGWFRDHFAGSKSNKQLACLWEKVALQFNILTSASVRIPSTSLKNKVYALKLQYNNSKKCVEATGNDTENPIEYPSYWEHLVTAFGDMKGIGHLEFGTEIPSSVWDVNNGSGVEDGDGNLHVDDAERQRKRIVAGEVDRQRQLRKYCKTDVGAGLVVSLGAALAQGMVDAATISKESPDKPNGFSAILERTEAALAKSAAVQEETNIALQRGNELQEQLLAFLMNKFTE